MFNTLPARAQPAAPHTTRKQALLRGCVLWLALCMLLAQSLGQLHSVKHGNVGHASRAVSAIVAICDGGFLDLLFSSHSSGKDCRLYDQAHDGQGMPSVAAAFLPVLLPSSAVASFQGEALARWAALFDARGPPLTF